VIIVYRCPMCGSNVQPVLRLIVKPVVHCSTCRTPMRVQPGMVVNSWMHGLYVWGVLASWLFLSGLGFVTQALTMPPAKAIGFMIGLLLIGWVPGLILSLPLLLVGNFIGHIMAWRLQRSPTTTYQEYSDPDAYVPQEHDWK
jgi:hypothetical protein